MKSRRIELFIGIACLLLGVALIGYDIYRNSLFGSPENVEMPSLAVLYPKDAQVCKTMPVIATPTSENIVVSKPSAFTRDLIVKKEENFIRFLEKNGVNKKIAQEIFDAIKKYYKNTTVKRGQRLYLFYSKVKDQTPLALQRVVFLTPPGKKFSLIKSPETGSFVSEYPPFSLPNTLKYFKGTIQKSIYSDVLRVGMTEQNLNKIAKLLSYSLDLQRSIYPGDTFEVLIEKAYDEETGFVDTGSIVYIRLASKTQEHKMYRYSLKETELEYFDENGHGVRKALLQTPVKGARINSGFGHRKHPILGFTKLHKGIDFKACTGTPIMCAGDGFVKKMGYLGSYGNYILIQHSLTYSTAYAHLSRYAKTIRKGSHIKQGDIIGYVGATGRATGPHLHYEILYKNKQINPKDLKMPSQKHLQRKDLENFTFYRRALDKKIHGLKYS